MKKIIQTTEAPLPIGCYSQAIQVGNMIHISGQIALDPASGELVGNNIQQQVKQVFENIDAVARASGGDINQVVALTVYLMKLSDIDAVNAAITDYFKEPWPARTTIQVSALPRQALVEITAMMIID
ncbi:MAG: Rid family detoxifying hydrolase [Gammaproteobacteria bacterium]|nr:Rid family detoxifying hydrolase [Gammaproteobacteria bacterium]